jgi:hypothetical protein
MAPYSLVAVFQRFWEIRCSIFQYVCLSEISAPTYQTARGYKPEDAILTVESIPQSDNLYLCGKVRAVMAYEGVESYLHSFLSSALDLVSGQLHASAALPPWKWSPVHSK